MSYKNSLNVIDKHFFGKPLLQWAAERADMPTKVSKNVESSVDDFNKYFDFMLRAFKRPLERTPDIDVYVPEKRVISLANIKDSFGPLFY